MFKFIRSGVLIAQISSSTALANTQASDTFTIEYSVDHVATLSMQDDN